MTPFDPTALLVMLLTFYPVVSGEELLRARRERPEYFAGGEIIGRHSDALRLPDGIVWDLIFNVDGLPGTQRWQAIIPGGGSGAGDPEFVLAAGPLAPLDEQRFPRPTPAAIFEPLVTDALLELRGSDAVLERVVTEALEAGSPAAIDAAFESQLAAASSAPADLHALLDAADPSDVMRTTSNMDPRIDAREADYDEPPPGDMPDATPPAPGTPPPDVPLPPGQDAQRAGDGGTIDRGSEPIGKMPA